MNLKFNVKKSLIPNDGSIDVINQFVSNTKDQDLDLLIFPDVHYKKDANVVNGMLTASNQYIYPSMLGVANCGFSFGKIKDCHFKDKDDVLKSFEVLSTKLKDYNFKKIYTKNQILSFFKDELNIFYSQDQNSSLLNFLNIKTQNDISKLIRSKLSKRHIEMAKCSLGTLGGGNHFFEIHNVIKSHEDDIKVNELIYILHSDSIAVGSDVLLLHSNLEELNYLKGFDRIKSKLALRKAQIIYFLSNNLFFKDPINVFKLIFSKNKYRGINYSSHLGKDLLKSFVIAHVFGEMNRKMILKNYESIISSIGVNYKLDPIDSHSHDSINIESIKGKLKLVQRNGVQKIKSNNKFVIPGALGTNAFLMKYPSGNEEVYHSCNHGVGRKLDKHLSSKEFSKENTEKDLLDLNLKLFKIGKGKIEEQNKKSFKNVEDVISEMKDQNLGYPIAELFPVCSIKG
jgi:RNA-splicing ligase RtcB